MIFTADQGELAAAVARAAQGLPGHPPAPIYAGMLLETDLDADMLHLAASDGDVTFTACFGCKPEAYGKCVVPGRLFADVIRTLGDYPVRMEQKGNAVEITCRKARFTLPARDGEEYPQWAEPGYRMGDDLGPEFPKILRRVAVAASDEAHTPALTAICLTAGDDLLKLVATDHSRLAYEEIPWFFAASAQGPYGGLITSADVSTLPRTALLPAKAAERFARECGEKTWISWNENVISLISLVGDGDVKMIARQVAAGYLPAASIRRVLDKQPAVSYDFGVAQLTAAIRLAQLAAPDNRITLGFGNEMITVTSGDMTGGCTEEVPCAYPGEPATFSFGARQVLDGLAGCGEDAEIAFTRPPAPLFLRSGSFRYMLQPRREL